MLHRMTYEVWTRYNDHCRQAKCIDFDDILVFCAHMLEREPSAAEELSNRFKFIMLDEYQDTNPVQMRIMDAIARYHKNIFVVGDEKQAIYGFRGSDVKVILGFLNRYKDANLIGMTRNYRSNPLIIDCANAIATAMNQRVPSSDGQLIAQSKLAPSPPVFSEFNSPRDEAKAIVKSIQADLRNGIPAKEIAVLYRSRMLKTDLEKFLVDTDVPYMLVGDTAFFQRAEVKDTVAFLKFVFQPWDSMSGLRVLSKIAIGVSENKAKAAMQKDGLTVYDFLKLESQKRLKTSKANTEAPFSKSALKVQAFLGPMEAVRQGYEYFDEPERLTECLADIWDVFYRPQVEKVAKKGSSNDSQESTNAKIDNITFLLERLRDELKRGKTVEEAIEDLSLMTDATPDLDRELDSKVRLMTMHASKGLEFQSCYIIGCDSESLSAKAEEDFDTIEENRRLLYVAVTRAMAKLDISWCTERPIFGNWTKVLPSPFITEAVESRNYPIKRQQPNYW